MSGLHCADEKETSSSTSNGDAPRLSIANKKFMHYNDDILLPFIESTRETLGWKEGQEIPEWTTTVSWFDRDIPQLQRMLFEAREAVDLALRIIHCKHAAAATGIHEVGCGCNRCVKPASSTPTSVAARPPSRAREEPSGDEADKSDEEVAKKARLAGA